jgi:HlyD family secretion protein
MPQPKKSPILAIIVLVVLTIAVLSYYRSHRGDAGIDGSLRLYGNMDLREVALSFMVRDRIVEELVDEGNEVKKGQLLARLDPVRFQAAVNQLRGERQQAKEKLAALVNGTRPQEIQKVRADVAAAEAAFKNAEVTYRRNVRLARDSAASQQKVDDSLREVGVKRAALKAARESLSLALEGPRKEDIAAARGAVRAIEASLVKAQKDLSDTHLLAPADGIIRARILEPGDIAGPGQPVFSLAKVDPVWIRSYLPEPDLGRVAPGMAATITTDSFPDKSYAGWVGYISPSAEFTPKNVETPELRTRLVYQLWVYACNPSRELRLGMPATVDIDLNSKAGGQAPPPCVGPAPEVPQDGDTESGSDKASDGVAGDNSATRQSDNDRSSH